MAGKRPTSDTLEDTPAKKSRTMFDEANEKEVTEKAKHLMQHNMDALFNAVDQKDEKIADLEISLRAAEKKASDMQNRAENEEMEKYDAKDKIEELEAQVTDTTKKLLKRTELIGHYYTKILRLERQLKGKEEKISNLQAEVGIYHQIKDMVTGNKDRKGKESS